MLDLELRGFERKEYLKKLKAVDYLSGPNKDANDTARLPYWEFGMIIKKKDIYIKITMNKRNKSALCISFHLAGYPLQYKFK